MIVPMEKKPSIRIAGYLEKRGKMRLLVCRWKRWWFVLEGRLLLYYKSQMEYLNLSPCRGSLNLGLVSCVRPGKGLELSVVTRSQTVVLRASNRTDHEQWLQSLLDSAALPNKQTFVTKPGVLHFRYSSQEHHEKIIERVKNFRYPSYAKMSDETSTTPAPSGSYETSTSSSHSSNIGQSSGCVLRRVFSDSRTLLRRPYKHRNSARNSARLSKIAFSDTSIPASAQEQETSPSDKCQSMQELRNSVSVSEENVLVKCEESKNSKEIVKSVLKGSKESRLSNSIKIELNLENFDSISEERMKEQKIGNVKITLDGCKIYGNTELKYNTESVENGCKNSVLKDQSNFINTITSTPPLLKKEVRSETDLSVKQKKRAQSSSCENLQTLDRSIGSTYSHAYERIEPIQRDERVPNLINLESSSRKSNKKRSNSILSRFRDSKIETENGSLERRGTIKKRLSFLRKVWKKRERKSEEEEYESADYDSIPDVIELPSPESEKAEELLLSLERQPDLCPEPEPPPDYDISISEELEIPPMLPPRQKQRPVSPWHDIPTNNKPVLPIEQDLPPPLPEKRKKRKTHQFLIKITDDSSCVEQTHSSLGADSVNCESPSRNGEQKLEDLDLLLAQLSEVNTYVVRQIDVSQTEEGNILQVSAAPEPVYDIPRPHISLLATLRSRTTRSETFTPTHFLCTTPLIDTDSLDPVFSRLDAEMTPDSLECDTAWSMSHPTNSSGSSHSGSLMRSFITSEDKPFPDSLNS